MYRNGYEEAVSCVSQGPLKLNGRVLIKDAQPVLEGIIALKWFEVDHEPFRIDFVLMALADENGERVVGGHGGNVSS